MLSFCILPNLTAFSSDFPNCALRDLESLPQTWCFIPYSTTTRLGIRRLIIIRRVSFKSAGELHTCRPTITSQLYISDSEPFTFSKRHILHFRNPGVYRAQDGSGGRERVRNHHPSLCQATCLLNSDKPILSVASSSPRHGMTTT